MKVTYLSSFLYFILSISGINASTLYSVEYNPLYVQDSTLYFYKTSTDKKITPEIRISYIDSAIIIASRENKDSLYLKYLAYKSTIYGQIKAYDTAVAQAQLLLVESQQRKQDKYIARAYEKLGLYFKNVQKYDLAYKNGKEALIRYKVLEDYEKVLKVSKRLANIQFILGDLAGAEQTSVDALAIASFVSDNTEVVWHYDLIAKIYQRRSFFKDAIFFHKNALGREKSPKSRGTLLNNYGLTLSKQGDYEAAIAIFKEGLLQDGITTRSKNRLLDNLAVAQSKINKPDAESTMLAALAARKKDKDVEGMFASTVHLSTFYKSIDTKKSKYWTKESIALADSLGSPDALLEALTLEIDMGMSTKDRMIKYTRLRDSLDQVQNQYAFQFAKIRYDFSEAEKATNTALQQKEKSELKTQRAILGFIAVLLISSLLLVYQMQRAKRKQLEERYVTESKISKRVHDELANDMFSIRAELAIQKTKESTLNKLDDLYERTRDISKEFSRVDTGSNYFQFLSDMLRGMLSKDVKLILRGSENIDWNHISHKAKLALYRSLQELMINMKKHSNATAVVIAFAKAQNKVTVDYKDNGTKESEFLRKGSGLQNVESRISDLKGSFTFEIIKDIGCEASIEIPV